MRDDYRDLLRVIAVGVLCLAALFCAKKCDAANFWTWSPPAEYHAAAVRVESGGRAGSGIQITHGDLRGVLTAAHVISGRSATVTWQDGQQRTGAATTDKFGHDLAFVAVSRNTAAVPIARRGPRAGDRVEYVTLGGPQQKLRPFFATVRAAGDKLETDGHVTYGDSGGAILNGRGELVGIQSVGLGHAVGGDGSYKVFSGSGSAPFRAAAAFVGRVIATGFG